MTVLKAYVNAVISKRNCLEKENFKWADKWSQRIEQLNGCLPHGGGFDGIVGFVEEESTARKVVIMCEYHYMNYHGYYDGWYTFKVVVISEFLGPRLKAYGVNWAGIKEYVEDSLYNALSAEAPKYPFSCS